MIHLTLESASFVLPNSDLELEFVRLTSLAGFRKAASKEYLFVEGIIDTGGYVTVIPRRLAAEMELEIKGDYRLMGVNPRNECAIPVKVAYGHCLLFDSQGNRSAEKRIPCYISQTEEVPVILGFAGLLSKFEVCFDVRTAKAYLKD